MDSTEIKKLVDEAVKDYMDNLKEDLIFRIAEIIEVDMIEKQKGLQSPYIKVFETEGEKEEKTEDKTKDKDLII
jgi:hypothetical protein